MPAKSEPTIAPELRSLTPTEEFADMLFGAEHEQLLVEGVSRSQLRELMAPALTVERVGMLVASLAFQWVEPHLIPNTDGDAMPYMLDRDYMQRLKKVYVSIDADSFFLVPGGEEEFARLAYLVDRVRTISKAKLEADFSGIINDAEWTLMWSYTRHLHYLSPLFDDAPNITELRRLLNPLWFEITGQVKR